MLRIGLTGGIASGKTLVSDELARLGAIIIDADVLARQAVRPGSAGLQEIVSRFGTRVLQDDGSLDRATLGEIVFQDSAAMKDLNNIVHPRVRAEAGRLEEDAPRDGVVVHAIPLLVETGQEGAFDAVIVVDAPETVQLRRLMDRNDLTSEQAQARMNSQASRSQRAAAATHLVDNSGEPEETRRRVSELWAELLRR